VQVQKKIRTPRWRVAASARRAAWHSRSNRIGNLAKNPNIANLEKRARYLEVYGIASCQRNDNWKSRHIEAPAIIGTCINCITPGSLSAKLALILIGEFIAAYTERRKLLAAKSR
jgi:hypothetical protein